MEKSALQIRYSSGEKLTDVDSLWNLNVFVLVVLVTVPFNPHFTRTLSETGKKVKRSAVGDHFQSSFYKDTLWNLTAICPNARKRSFNPHFTRTLSETVLLFGDPGVAKTLSILILQGHSLKQSRKQVEKWVISSFNPHFTRTLSETSSREAGWKPIKTTFNPHFTRTLSETSSIHVSIKSK